MPEAVAFDLGDTLVEYEGLPLSWEAHYPEALGNLTAAAGHAMAPGHVEAACAILRRHNTRVVPRSREVAFSEIMDELAVVFGVKWELDEATLARAFFRIFRQRLRCFSDTLPALGELRKKGVKIGIFTDVPYGMPSELVLEDVAQSGLTGRYDVLITSRDIGWRKPSIATLQALAESLGTSSSGLIHVGNEKKDVEVAISFGCESILIARNGRPGAWGQDRTISTLSEL
jgi:putative hydrolase of the HAD superfamily